MGPNGKTVFLGWEAESKTTETTATDSKPSPNLVERMDDLKKTVDEILALLRQSKTQDQSEESEEE